MHLRSLQVNTVTEQGDFRDDAEYIRRHPINKPVIVKVFLKLSTARSLLLIDAQSRFRGSSKKGKNSVCDRRMSSHPVKKECDMLQRLSSDCTLL